MPRFAARLSLLGLLLPLALGACESMQEEELALRGQRELVGLTDQKLKLCAGEPTAAAREQGRDYWQYFREATRNVDIGATRDGSVLESSLGRTPIERGSGSYDYFRYCEATFELQNGMVRSIAYKGRTSTGRETLTACAQIVAPCLKLAR